MPWNSDAPIKEILINNMYYGTTVLIKEYGAPTALLFIGLFLIVTTLLKTGFYFASSAIMVPLRTNVVRDIRVQLYNKVVRLPLSFMSDERKGDIIARMSGDVLEVENSITSSLDMLIKNPILILFYFVGMYRCPSAASRFPDFRCLSGGFCESETGRRGKSDFVSRKRYHLFGNRTVSLYIRSRLGLISSRHDCRCFRPALSRWRPRVMRALLRKWIFRKTNINLRPPVTGKPRFVCSRSEKRHWAMWRLRLPKS